MKTLITRRQALAATYALALAPFTAGAAEREKVGMQLILAADVSGSVNATRYKTQQDGYLEALGDPHVLDVIGGLDPAGRCDHLYRMGSRPGSDGALDAGARCQNDGLVPQPIERRTTSAYRHQHPERPSLTRPSRSPSDQRPLNQVERVCSLGCALEGRATLARFDML